jgi:hypothetical protein
LALFLEFGVPLKDNWVLATLIE